MAAHRMTSSRVTSKRAARKALLPRMRETLRARQQDLRSALAQKRRDAQAALHAMPAVQNERRRQRRRRTVLLMLLLVLLLLLLMSRCDCAPPVVAPPTPTPVEVTRVAPAIVVAPPAKPKRWSGRVPAQPRGAYENHASAAPSWLQEFRLQVAARGPRLAACFNGAARPGAWRWGAAVHAKRGAVSDHVLEPVGTGAEVTAEQRACLVKVLSSPAYRLVLTADDDDSLPARVSLLIEF
jgi:hypothetical protein